MLIMGFFFCSSLFFSFSNGLQWRIPIERHAMSAKQHRADETSFCSKETLEEKFITCHVPRRSDKSIYIWGDSHARHLVAGFAEHYPDYNIFIIYKTGCFPQSGLGGYTQIFKGRKKQEKNCAKFNQDAYNYFQTIKPSNIILTAYLYEGVTEKIGNPTKLILDTLKEYGHNSFFLANVIPPLKPLIECYNVPDYIVTTKLIEKRCIGNKEKTLRLREEYKIMRAVIGEAGFLNTDTVLCSNQTCQTFFEGSPLFRDKSHLTIFGSKYFVGKITKDLNKNII